VACLRRLPACGFRQRANAPVPPLAECPPARPRLRHSARAPTVAHATDEAGGPEHAPGVFDWFPTHGDRDPVISTLLDAGVPKTGRILDIGCGNSQVCLQLREAGFTRVVGVDFSEVVISNMRRQAASDSGGASQPGHTQHFFAMDATNLSFSDGSFDAVTDKGLLDSVCFEHDHWYSQQKASQRGQDPAASGQVCCVCEHPDPLAHTLAA